MIQLSIYPVANTVKIPEYSDSMAACFDVFFCPTINIISGYNGHGIPINRPLNADKSFNIHPGDRLLIPTGLKFKIRRLHSVETFADITREEEELRQFSIRLHSNPALALKSGITLLVNEGVIDADHQEEVFIPMTNVSGITTTIEYQEKICQGEVIVNELLSLVPFVEQPTPKKQVISSDVLESTIRDLEY
jgi:dUTPase